jgi:taurine dioxygenase
MLDLQDVASARKADIVVTPLCGPLGAEITGADLSGDVDEATIRTIRDAVLRHMVVVVRDQHLTPVDQLRFAGRLGPLKAEDSRATLNQFAPPGYPQLAIVSNIIENGKPIGMTDAGLLWHSDTCYRTTPELFVTLYAITVPQRDGVALGNTKFSSTVAAYEALDAETKSRIEGRRVRQSYVHSLDKMAEKQMLRRPPLTKAQSDNLQEQWHPLARTHPITGRKLLYASEGFSCGISGMDDAEALPLLAQLSAHAVDEAFVYSHNWREGDLVIWDNCATQHLATFDYGTIPRRMHRCGVIGPAPE